MPPLAYKIRVQIAKNLQRRSKAIRRAIKAYNAAAARLTPPRPALDWSKVSHYAFIEEFELLRDTRHDLRDKPWADVDTRQYMKKARNVARAKEEIRRCNIEVRRVHTAILLENEKLDHAVRASKNEGNPISGALADYSARRQRVNARLLAVIAQIHALPGFSGNPTPGRRKGVATNVPAPQSSGEVPGLDEEARELCVDDEEDPLDESGQGEMTRALNFVTNLV